MKLFSSIKSISELIKEFFHWEKSPFFHILEVYFRILSSVIPSLFNLIEEKSFIELNLKTSYIIKLNINYKSKNMNSKNIYQIKISGYPNSVYVSLINNDKSQDNPFEFFLYDTSGEHGLKDNLNRKNHNGINKLRLNWINDRNDTSKKKMEALIAN